MNSLPVPPPLAAPFAISGNRNTLPLSSGGNYGAASLLEGFPPETSIPVSNGGIPPSREDMNALGYAASFPQYYLEMGGYYTYDPNVASAIGGYPLGAVLTYYNSSGREVRKLRSLVANNSANFITSPGVIGSAWQDVTPIVGVGRTMFEFFWNFSTEIPAGALELNGQLLTGCNSQSSVYYEFYTEGKRLAAAGKIATKTMAQYVADLTNYGECNAFVFDQNLSGVAQNGCIRIPTVRHFIQAGTPGNIHSAGLPNITGYVDGFAHNGWNVSSSGALFLSGSGRIGLGGSIDYDNPGVGFNANSGAAVKGIYGGAQTVQPQSVELVPCIQYASGSGGTGGLPSGVIVENQPFSTTVGGYTVELTSNGVSIYGSGASVTLSGGEVNVSAKQGIGAELNNGDEAILAVMSAGLGGVVLHYDDTEYDTTLEVGQGVTANGSAITQVSSGIEDTSLGIDVLEGGVKYICSSALSALSIGSAAAGCNGTIIFTVASGAIVTPPANVPYFGVTEYTPGSSYLMMINDFAAVCNEAAVPVGV